jgi:hypothetical protein
VLGPALFDLVNLFLCGCTVDEGGAENDVLGPAPPDFLFKEKLGTTVRVD